MSRDSCSAHGAHPTVNITRFVNSKTLSNSQNEYKIFLLSIIGQYVGKIFEFYTKTLSFLCIHWYSFVLTEETSNLIRHIFQLWTMKRSYIHSVNYL